MDLMRDFANYAIARYCDITVATTKSRTSTAPSSSLPNATTATAEVVTKAPHCPRQAFPKQGQLRRKTYKSESSNNPTSCTNYVGITPIETGYQAQIVYDIKTFHLGSYVLQSDAACIYDMALERLGMNGNEEVSNNFQSFDEYHAARAHEMKALGMKIDLKEVISFGRERLDEMMEAIVPSSKRSTVVAHEIQRKNDTDADCNDKDDGDEDVIVLESCPPIATPQTKTDSATSLSEKRKYIGSTRIPRKSNSLHSKPYLSKIVHKKQHFILGYYRLDADAAWAYDKAAKLLKIGDDGGTEGKVNFRSKSEYHAARELEMKEVGFRVTRNEAKVTRREKLNDVRLYVKKLKPKRSKISKFSRATTAANFGAKDSTGNHSNPWAKMADNAL